MITPIHEFKEIIAKNKGVVNDLELLIKAIKGRLKENLSEYEKRSLKLELRSKLSHLEVAKDGLESRQSHFENYFMPNFEKESKECNEYFYKVLAEAKELINTKDASPMLVSGLKRLIEEYPKDNKEQEFKVSLYLALKWQLESYKRHKKRLKQQEASEKEKPIFEKTILSLITFLEWLIRKLEWLIRKTDNNE